MKVTALSVETVLENEINPESIPSNIVDAYHMLAEYKRRLDECNDIIRKLRHAEKNHLRLMQMAKHDVKNTIHNLRMGESLLRNDINNEAEMKILDSMVLSLDMLEEVIQDVAEAMPLGSTDKMDMNPQPISVGRLVSDVLLQFSATAYRKGITLNVEMLDGWMCADKTRLTQVVSNLVSNAVKYTPPGTVVHVWTEQHGADIRLCVADQGPGIPEHERHLLFTEFGKLSTRPTGQEGSTGLGLWIVRNIIEAMGGTYGAETPSGSTGALFWIQLPATHAETCEPLIIA